MPDQATQSNGDWTIGRLLAWTRQHLETAGVEEPRLSAELLLAKAVDCPRIGLYTRFDQKPSDDQRAAFRELVRAAAQHHPVAYLVGRKEFYSLDFLVTPDVLIPRPETELLVERALAWCSAHEQDRYDVADLGTGSGCIAVSIAKRRPAAHVVATDISEAALAITMQNATRHGVDDRVTPVRADWLNLPRADDGRDYRFDIIVSNPPYIADSARETLSKDVRDYEPATALFVHGDGLEAYRRIASGIRPHLRPGGCLLLEVGCDQAADVEKLFLATAGLRPAARHKDLAGIDRALELTLPA